MFHFCTYEISIVLEILSEELASANYLFERSPSPSPTSSASYFKTDGQSVRQPAIYAYSFGIERLLCLITMFLYMSVGK